MIFVKLVENVQSKLYLVFIKLLITYCQYVKR